MVNVFFKDPKKTDVYKIANEKTEFVMYSLRGVAEPPVMDHDHNGGRNWE